MSTFLEKKLNKAWKSVFEPGSSFYLPGKLPESYTGEDILKKDGEDLGRTVPDIWIVVGVVPEGNAGAFIPSATLRGIQSLTIDPNNPDLVFAEDDKTATMFVQFPQLVAEGRWKIGQGMKNYTGCGLPDMYRAMRAAAPSEDDLAPFYKLQEDLQTKGGEMGRWYLAQYDANREAIIALPDDERFKKAIKRFDGPAVWDAIIATIKAAGSGSPVSFPQSLQQKALGLVMAAVQCTTSETLKISINQIVDYVPHYFGKTYDQALQTVASETQPDKTRVGAASFAVSGSDVARAVVPWDPTKIGNVTVRYWDGTFRATAVEFKASIKVAITTGVDGGAPTITTKSLTVNMDKGFKLEYGGDDWQSQLEVFFQKCFFPSATAGIDDMIKDKIEGSQDAKNAISSALTEGIKQIWDAPIT